MEETAGAVITKGAGATGYDARSVCWFIGGLVGEGLLLLLTAVTVLGELRLTGGGMKVRTPGCRGYSKGGEM